MLKIYNTITRSVEEFKPLNPPHVGIYTCGPTVYDFAHIGNFRTYTISDLLVRNLKYNNYDVLYIMNLTDVGHLTGDNLGDADSGEDRMEKSAKKEGKSAWDIAEFYTQAFLKDYDRLNLTRPKIFAKATDHIKEQIELIKRLEEKGFTYQISDGIYFDTSKFPDYGKLSNLDQIKEGARVEPNPEKKNPRDFALWKFSPAHEKRQMEWESPWARPPATSSKQSDTNQTGVAGEVGRGKGFPGWHIECSAMSMKYLGETFDIHAGGIDLSSTHHPNEIAQSEAVTGKPFVNYWVHGAFILVDGKRMSKSLGNNYKVQDLIDKGYDPMSLRYLYMQTHYRQEMNFTFEALDGAAQALKKLQAEIVDMEDGRVGCAEFEQNFADALNDDLNMPKALAIVWELLKSKYPSGAKKVSLLKFDKVLGLNLDKEYKQKIPKEIKQLAKLREKHRAEQQFAKADEIRDKIRAMGYEVRDSDTGESEIRKVI